MNGFSKLVNGVWMKGHCLVLLALWCSAIGLWRDCWMDWRWSKECGVSPSSLLVQSDSTYFYLCFLVHSLRLQMKTLPTSLGSSSLTSLCKKYLHKAKFYLEKFGPGRRKNFNCPKKVHFSANVCGELWNWPSFHLSTPSVAWRATVPRPLILA